MGAVGDGGSWCEHCTKQETSCQLVGSERWQNWAGELYTFFYFFVSQKLAFCVIDDAEHERVQPENIVLLRRVNRGQATAIISA